MMGFIADTNNALGVVQHLNRPPEGRLFWGGNNILPADLLYQDVVEH